MLAMFRQREDETMRKQDLNAARVYSNAERADAIGGVVVLVSTTLIHRDAPDKVAGRGGWGQLRAAKAGEKPGEMRSSSWGRSLISEVGYLVVRVTDKADHAALLAGVDDQGRTTTVEAAQVVTDALAWAARTAGPNQDAYVTESYNHRFSLVIEQSRTLRPLIAHRAALAATQIAKEEAIIARRRREDELTSLREQAERELARLDMSLADPEDQEIHHSYRLVPVPVETLAQLVRWAGQDRV
jgi:hypothetical protein